MLNALYRYAIRENLVLPAGYVKKTIRAYVSLGADGRFLGVIPGDADKVPCPDIGSMANSGEKCNVLAEKRSILFPGDEKQRDQYAAKRAYFQAALSEAAREEPRLTVCLKAMGDETVFAAVSAELDRMKVDKSNVLTFLVDGQSVLEMPKVLNWWGTFRRQFQPSGAKSLCLITGNPAVPMTTVPPISGLSVVGRPSFDVVSAGDDGLVLKATVYVKPDVKVKNYLGITAEKKSKVADDADVDAEINRTRERNGRTLDVTDRPAQSGDSVNIDFDGSVDGVAFEGGKAEKFDLRLGSGQFIPGFEDQVAGRNIGDEFDVSVTFPADYHAENLAGKPAVFRVKLNGIKATELPALDDEFAKDVSEFDTLDEYKADVRAKIQKRYDQEADAAFEEKLIDTILENTEADIPEVMFEEETENFVRDYENRLRMQGLDLNTYFKYTGMNMDALKQQMRPQAEKQVRLRLALEAIADAENPQISEEAVEEEYKRIADSYGITADKVKELVDRDGILADLKVKAAMDLVKDKAVVAP